MNWNEFQIIATIEIIGKIKTFKKLNLSNEEIPNIAVMVTTRCCGLELFLLTCVDRKLVVVFVEF